MPRHGPRGVRALRAAVDGRGQRLIGGGVAWELAPSPDGAAIAFVGCEDDSCALQTVAADGSGDVRTVTEEVPGWMSANLAWPTPGILHTAQTVFVVDAVTGAIQPVTYRSPTGRVGKPGAGAYGSVAVFLP